MNSEKRITRRVCVVLVDRANYGRLKPVMAAIQRSHELELQVVAAGTMVLERFQLPVVQVRQDGFPISAEVYMEVEGSTPTTMAKSVGFGIVEFAGVFQRLRPDIVLIIGDRYEALAATIAAGYMNLCVVHLQGGEVSGSMDENARHAISRFAHFHFPATRRAAEFLMRMGELPETILGVGCPSSDIARGVDLTAVPTVVNESGAGGEIDLAKPFLLCVFHPNTTDYDGTRDQVKQLIGALELLEMQTVWLWPNIDAGADHISKQIRIFRTTRPRPWLRTLTNLSPEDYLRVLASTACAVGNSSSFVRDAGFFGTPVVLVGNRQDGREHDVHLVNVPVEAADIAGAVRAQLRAGRYPPSSLYGDGAVSARIVEGLVRLVPYSQKRLSFVSESRALT